MLGIVLTDADVLNVPLLRTDAYGNFIPGANGYAQIATATGFVEGSAAGTPVPANAFRTGHAFLDDIAHTAVPVVVNGVLQADPDTDYGNAVPVNNQGRNTQYDNELLDAHFVTGDGRVIMQGMQTLEFPGPALPALIERRLTEDGLQQVLRALEQTNLFTGDLELRGMNGMVADANDTIGARPLVRSNSPQAGVRPLPTMRRTDCGWIA